MVRFNPKKLNETEVKEQYRVEVSYVCGFGRFGRRGEN
jgi:hypothetical protein